MPIGDVAWALEDVAARSRAYALYGRYYDGDHELLFATEKYRNAFANLFRAFADNLCPTVVDGISDRLNVSGFDGDLAKEAQAVWTKLKVRRASNQMMRDALKMGDSMLLVWKAADGKPRLWPQHPEQIALLYDTEDPGTLTRAAKVWMDDDQHVRVTLYYADHNERYISKVRHPNGMPRTGDAFVGFNGDAAGAQVANPFGVVPIFHFANCDDLGEYGRSELDPVIPLQDALNKTVCDMLVAMEFHAYPQRYATGLTLEIDPETGKPKQTPFEPGADRVWTGGENVTFGQFPPTELTGYLGASKAFREEVARVSGIPLHYLNLSSQYPSGEALKISEGRLVKKVEDRQVNFGDIWSEALKLAIRMSGTTVADDAELRVLWNSAAPYNPMLDAETVLIKQQVGISTKQGLRELGYSDAQIDQIMQEVDDQAQQAADAAQAAFTRNGAPGQPSTPAPGQQTVGGLKPGTQPAAVSPVRPRPPATGEYHGAGG